MARKAKAKQEEQNSSSETAASRYEKLANERRPYLERARTCAALTLPALIPKNDPKDGSNPDYKLQTPFQGIGAEGVATLAARLLLTLFPPNMPMFRMQVNDWELQQNKQAQDPEWRTAVDTALGEYERQVQTHIEASGDRPAMHEALLHLLVAGNVLLFDGPDAKGVRVFTLPRFVARRDPMGSAVEMLIHETVALATLPDDVKAKVEAALHQSDGGGNTDNRERNVDIYTHVQRQGDKWHSYQECAGEKIEGSEGEYPLDGCPWLPLRMYWVAGEDYGRSYVENYLGDLKSLEALTQAIVEGSAIGAKILFLIRPGGSTKAVDLQRASNGSFVSGNVEEVATLQVGKAADLRTAFEAAKNIEGRLAKAFLLLDGMRRDAERVTAEEIRAVANELEESLGGIYSMMSQEFQLPYIKRKIHKLSKHGKLPVLPDKAVQPAIVTGFEALGRGNDKTKLVSFISTITETLGREVAAQYLNIPDYLSRLAAADGINTNGLVKSTEELQAEKEQTEQMQLTQSLGPKAMDVLGKAAQSQPQPEMAVPQGGGI